MVLSQETLISRLSFPERKVRIVIDTDTYNEIDDQFAVTYALNSTENFNIEAFYAAPFYNELSNSPNDGMEKSYNELKKILSLLKRDEIPVFKGSETYLPKDYKPVKSEAVNDLIKRALDAPDDDPLYVVAIGAITNVASAILLEPKIIEKIVVIWLGGHAINWPDTKEFNLFQDLYASRTMFDSGVPLILAPCDGVVSHLITTLPELEQNIGHCGEVGKYLCDTFTRYRDIKLRDERNKMKGAYSRVLWDLAPIAYLNNQEWAASTLISSPIISEEFRWSFDPNRHLIRYIYKVDRDSIIGDFYKKLNKAYSN